jgi:class 3 adenylate cyclase/CHAT domain-containing protein
MSEKDKPSPLDEILRQRKDLDEIINTQFKRPTTVLFTDIVGSTTFFSTRGDIEGQLMIQRHNDLLIPLISQYQGTLIEIIGDAIFASFEEPSNAVACAVRMQEALAQDTQARPEKDHIKVRIGINLGSGYVDAGHVRGIVVNIAERVKSLAGAGEILISESVYKALQPGRDPICGFLDKVQVKGVEEEIKIYQVMWKGAERRQAVRGNVGHEAGTTGEIVLEASRENGNVKVCVYEKNNAGARTLRPYENVEVDWEQIEASRREIITLLNRANRRAKVTPEILESLKKSGQLLFDLLIPAKAREKISATDARNLLLYVDDKLVHVPWELLFDGKQFFCRRFAMGRIVSTRQAPTSLSSRKLKPPFKVLVLADPRGDLEASYREGMEIKNYLDEKREVFHVDFKSHPVDIPFVKKNLRDYDVVHYAGHGDYHSDNPAESGWLLKDGRLKASEISAMGGLQPMPSLVFSNACQTGHTSEWQIQDGYEQQIFGLANAYLLAGVQHYIGTFWEILDEPSGYFAKRFYSFLAQGVKVGEAVRRARLELIDAYGEETIVWATYMLYGDPTFEFAAAQPETVVAAPRPAPKTEWQQVTRGEKLPKPVPSATVRAPYLYPALGALLIVIGYLGYQFLSPDEKPQQKIASVAAPVTSSVAEEKAKAVQGAETKTVPAPEVKKGSEITKAKEATPEVKAKEKPAAKEPAPVQVAKTSQFTPAQPAKSQEITPPPAAVKEEVAVVKETAPAVVAMPLRLSMNIIGQRKEADGSYTEILVSEGSVLRSRDNFQIHLEASRPAYVYILLYDSQGKASQIFPDPKANQSGSVEGGRKLVVPSRDLWFWLDESTGTETIYVLASEKPMSDISVLLAKMEGGDDAGQKRASQEIKQRIAVMQRGVGGIVKGQTVVYSLSDGKKIQKVTDVVTGTGSVVRAVSFQHR